MIVNNDSMSTVTSALGLMSHADNLGTEFLCKGCGNVMCVVLVVMIRCVGLLKLGNLWLG